jgi:L-threonylcarbamoyladenylate synthase
MESAAPGSARPLIVADTTAGRATAIAALRAGGIVALPTDTVYGIGVALDTPGGIERLFAAKDRPPDKAIALLLAEPDQADEIGLLGRAARALARALWPGGLTLVVARRQDRPLPAALTGGALVPGAVPTVGLRVPDHPAPRALAAALGPLPTTSANRSGEREARDASEIVERLGQAIDLVLDGGPASGGPPSTVIDATGEALRVIRDGAIGRATLREVVRSAGLAGVTILD